MSYLYGVWSTKKGDRHSSYGVRPSRGGISYSGTLHPQETKSHDLVRLEMDKGERSYGQKMDKPYVQDLYNPLLRGVCTRREQLYEKFKGICAEICAIHVKLSEELAQVEEVVRPGSRSARVNSDSAKVAVDLMGYTSMANQTRAEEAALGKNEVTV